MVDTARHLLQCIVDQVVQEGPLRNVSLLCAGATTWTWLSSVITGKCTQIDRLWSIMPPLYACLVALHPSARGDSRLLVMAVLPTLWGIRLTYNFWRKGGYKPGEEDYRWAVVRKAVPNPILFHLLNFFIICLYQHILLFLFVSPVYVAWSHRGLPLNLGDIISAISFLAFLLGETISDQQQWVFQQKKWEMINNEKKRYGDFLGGFLTRGLFRYSRHPNFFCEVMIWFCYYGFSVAATGNYINWSILGPLLLTSLFQGSLSLTEYITGNKYPAYKFYCACTSRLLPWWPKSRTTLETTFTELEKKNN